MGMLALFLLGLLGVGMMLGTKPDPVMPAAVAAVYNAAMLNTNPDMVDSAAASFAAGGYPNAAAALRARAAQLRAQQAAPPGGGFPSAPGGFPGAPGGVPGGGTPTVGPIGPGGFGGDPPLPPDIQSMVNALLSDPHGDPTKLEMAASAMDVAGFHATAAALRARAALLRGTPGGVTPPPPPGVPSPAAPMPITAVYVIKPGDSASAIARKFTGDSTRWHELMDANPNLKASTVPVNGVPTTLVTPFNPGQILKLPASWPPVPPT
jgi:nucleoid-associated protein YgaU